MQNGFYEVQRPGRDRLLDRDGEVPARLPGAHRRLRLRDRHRRRPLRGRLPHRPRHQSLRLHLRARLRRAVRGQLPPRRRRCAGLHPRPEALRHRAVRPGDRRLRASIARPTTTACCRPTAATTSASRWSAPASPASPWRTTWSSIGYKVTVFEADCEPGGMLTVGVPVFRLPRDLVRHEIQAILSLGVELKCNMQPGPRFHHRQPAPRGLQGHLPRHRPAQGPQARPARRRDTKASSTAWISCAPSTTARPCRSASASS